MKFFECGDHLLDLSRVQAVADVCGHYQRCHVWCRSHRRHEWQWVATSTHDFVNAEAEDSAWATSR